jgi:hypothetical protein
MRAASKTPVPCDNQGRTPLILAILGEPFLLDNGALELLDVTSNAGNGGVGGIRCGLNYMDVEGIKVG